MSAEQVPILDIRRFDAQGPEERAGFVRELNTAYREIGFVGITRHAIGPGFFPTALPAAVFATAELAERHAAQTCIGRNGRLDDLHGATGFLASDASA